jgi:hypothetical protein
MTSNRDFQKTVIYSISCLDANVKEFFVSSTSNIVSKKSYHKSVFNNPNNKSYHKLIYKLMRQYGGFNNWRFIVLEKFPCSSMEDAVNREWFWYEKMQYKAEPTSTIATVRAKVIQYRINNRLTGLMLQTNEILKNEIKQQKLKYFLMT